MPAGVLRAVLRVLPGIGLVWGLCLLRDSLWARAYPLAVSLLVLGFFAASLFRTPLAETFARRMGETLDARGIRYCRRVTVAWVVFLSLHTAVTAATLLANRRIWAFYNGFLAYVLIGLMAAAEYCVRKRVKRGPNA